MNILFLIGNGFDLNLGMSTRYSDFYNYYKGVKSRSSVIEKLKNEISGNIENWSDLELELGKYTKSLNSDKEFTEVYEDLCDSLADYLELEEDKFDHKKFNINKLREYLSFPESSLPQADKLIVDAFKKKYAHVQWNIYIITFNYTQTLEQLLEYKKTRIHIGIHENSPIVLQRIEHIHGYLNDRMVVGVNDTTQISNHAFHNNQKVLVDLIKNDCNQAQKHMIDNWSKEQISNANLICIFGSSIGDTDNLWWKIIGEQLKKDTLLLIFEIGEVISPRRPQRKLLSEIEKKKYFLNKTALNDAEKKNAENKIIIGINTKMFDIKFKK